VIRHSETVGGGGELSLELHMSPSMYRCVCLEQGRKGENRREIETSRATPAGYMTTMTQLTQFEKRRETQSSATSLD